MNKLRDFYYEWHVTIDGFLGALCITVAMATLVLIAAMFGG